MNDAAQEVRIKIAQLAFKDQDMRTREKQIQKEAREARNELREARNELALLTASLFIIVDNSEEIVVYGVSPEVEKTEAHGLSLSLRADGIVEVSYQLPDNSVTHLVGAGGQTSFKITTNGGDDIEIYHVRVFKRKGEAEEWAEQRRLANTSC